MAFTIPSVKVATLVEATEATAVPAATIVAAVIVVRGFAPIQGRVLADRQHLLEHGVVDGTGAGEDVVARPALEDLDHGLDVIENVSAGVDKSEGERGR